MVPETIEVNRSGNFSKTKMIHRGILTSKNYSKIGNLNFRYGVQRIQNDQIINSLPIKRYQKKK